MIAQRVVKDNGKTGIVVTEPRLPDSGGYKMVVDVSWDNGTRTTEFTGALRYAN